MRLSHRKTEGGVRRNFLRYGATVKKPVEDCFPALLSQLSGNVIAIWLFNASLCFFGCAFFFHIGCLFMMTDFRPYVSAVNDLRNAQRQNIMT